MPKTTIEGSCISHSIVTDECRKNRGNVGALGEAYRRLLKQYRYLTDAAPHGAKIGAGFVFHVVLTIERPPEPAREKREVADFENHLGTHD